MSDVALALIATGQSKPAQANDDGNTALIMATEKNMLEVITAIHNDIDDAINNDIVFFDVNPGQALPAAGGKTKKNKNKKKRKTKKRRGFFF
jgi:hypothetical protein